MENNKLEIKRVVNAPIDRVFKAFTTEEDLKQWFAPERLTTPVAEVDLKVGGAYKIAMKEDNNGAVHTAYGVFKEIDPPHKVVYSWSWEGTDMGKDTQITVSLKDIGDGKTEVTFIHEFFASAPERDEHNKGWQSAFNKLEKFV